MLWRERSPTVLLDKAICKDDLKKVCHITRTPGVAPGGQLDIATELESFLKKQDPMSSKGNKFIIALED